MSRFSSLRIRILVLTTVPLSLLLLLFVVLTLRTARNAVDSSVRRSLRDAGSVFVKLLATRRNELVSMARVTARDPRFFATFSIPEDERGAEFAPTLQGVARDFLRITDADFLEVMDAKGALLASVSKRATEPASDIVEAPTGIQRTLTGGVPTTDFYLKQGQLAVAAIVPVYVTHRLEAVIRLGSVCDHEFLHEVRRLTGTAVCIALDGRVLASTMADVDDEVHEPYESNRSDAVPYARDAFAISEAFPMSRADVEYLAVQIRVEGGDQTAFDVYLSRELGSDLAPIVHVTEKMALIGIAAILATFLAAYLVARRITGPISKVVEAAEQLRAGNYEHPVQPQGADEIAFLGRSFVEMRDALRSHVQHLRNVDQMKSNFITLAGHELKTPLTVISSFNEMIVSGEMGSLPKDVMDTTQLIQEKLWDLDRLVENILDMSRAEQGLLELLTEERDLRDLMASVVDKRQAAVTRRSLELRATLPSEPCPVWIDARRIERAVLALVDNAVRFTPDAGTVHVELRRRAREVVISVRDSGIGISPADMRWIFEKAVEPVDVMHHSSGRFAFGSRGFGLGLALCKAIVEAHGGRIEAQSQPGVGSEFRIVLQLASTGPRQAEGDRDASQAVEPPREMETIVRS